MSVSSRLRVEIPGENYHRDLVSCQVGCPVNTDARGYVRAVAEGRFEEAYLIARAPNPFASICGRVCGAPCEAACRRGRIPRVDDDGRFVALDQPIAIRALKRFVCGQAGVDARLPEVVLPEIKGAAFGVCSGAEEMAALLRSHAQGQFLLAGGQRVAIVGAGPAGLSAAHDLALMGFKPVVFEAEPLPAGMLVIGVPAYRLPRELIAREVEVIRALGVEIRCGVTVGKEVSLARLRKEFSAVILAVGAKSSRGLGLPGERGPGVLGGVDLLRAVALGEPPALGREVVVVGGGNVAYDVARTVLRQIAYDAARTVARMLGTSRVLLASLETLEEMPADTQEIHEGDEEGVERMNGWGPLEILRDDWGDVTGIRFQRCLRVYDHNRRFAPLYNDEDVVTIPCDTVLMAVGQAPDLSLLGDGGGDLEQARPGWPKVDQETLSTTAPGVFVAGDLAHGTRLIIDAVASGKKAARSVYHYVTGRTLVQGQLTDYLTLDGYRRELGYEAVRRVAVPVLPPEERLKAPDRLVEEGFGPSEALREASRCLDCGVTPVFDGTRCVLCGGCADVCPTLCLKLVSLADLEPGGDWEATAQRSFGAGEDIYSHSAILKDEERCIRCALCAHRCPTQAITMERVTFSTRWRCS